MILLLLVASAAAIAALAKWIYEIKSFNAYLKHVPGSKPLPFVGNALDLIHPWKVLPTLEKYRKEHGRLSKLLIGPTRIKLLVFDYEFLEVLFSSKKITDKTSEYKNLRPWLGLGLLTSSGDRWQRKRKMLNPSFHYQILQNFLGIFHNKSNTLVGCLQPHLTDKSFDVYNYIALSALDVICESAMGITVNAQLDTSSKYVESVREIGRIFLERSLHPLKLFDFFFRFSKDYQKELNAVKILHKTTDGVIKKRKQIMDGRNQNVTVNEDGTKNRLAFLDLLLQETTPDGKSLSDAEIREEVDTFMFEGHETTASAMSFVLYLLSKHPDAQNKVFEEVRQILGDDPSKAPSFRDLQEMKYLKAVIQETLRLYPSIPIMGRQLPEDIVYDGHIYPKGLEVYAPSFSIHRISELFPDPLKFDPGRFSSENKSTRKPFSYLPFSAGPRNCIGQKFAMLEIKSTISKVLRHYELLESPGFDPILSAETTLKSLNGIHIRIKKRLY